MPNESKYTGPDRRSTWKECPPETKPTKPRPTGRQRQVSSRLQDAVFAIEFAVMNTDARTVHGRAIKRLHAQARKVHNDYWSHLYD